MNQTNRIIASELLFIARELLASDDYEYIYDPTHKKHPGSGFERTPKGWSRKRLTSPNQGALGDSFDKTLQKIHLKPTPISKKIESYQPEVEKCFVSIKKASDKINAELIRNAKESFAVNNKVEELARYQYSTGELTYDKRKGLYTRKNLLEKELNALYQRQQYIAFEGLKLPLEQRSKIQVGLVKSEAPEFKDIYKTPFKYLEMVVNKDVMPKTPLNVFIAKSKDDRKKNRAYCFDNNLNMNTSSKGSEWLHETAHWIENNNPKVKKRCIEFLEYRTQGEKPEQLNKLVGLEDNYEDNEFTKKDAFFNPYCGKLYIENGKIISTAILSMGLQELMEHPFQFFRNDPEYFGFVIGILRGDLL